MSALAEGLHEDNDDGPTEEVSITGQADDNSTLIVETRKRYCTYFVLA